MTDVEWWQFGMSFVVLVGYSTRYDPPRARVRPDEKVRQVVVWVEDGDDLEAQLVATYMVMCRPDCAMVTSTRIVEVAA